MLRYRSQYAEIKKQLADLSIRHEVDGGRLSASAQYYREVVDRAMLGSFSLSLYSFELARKVASPWRHFSLA